MEKTKYYNRFIISLKKFKRWANKLKLFYSTNIKQSLLNITPQSDVAQTTLRINDRTKNRQTVSSNNIILYTSKTSLYKKKDTATTIYSPFKRMRDHARQTPRHSIQLRAKYRFNQYTRKASCSRSPISYYPAKTATILMPAERTTASGRETRARARCEKKTLPRSLAK